MKKEKVRLVQVGSRIEKEHYAYLKRLARRMSVDQDRDISLSDLIRETLLREYPLPDENVERIGAIYQG